MQPTFPFFRVKCWMLQYPWSEPLTFSGHKSFRSHIMLDKKRREVSDGTHVISLVWKTTNYPYSNERGKSKRIEKCSRKGCQRRQLILKHLSKIYYLTCLLRLILSYLSLFIGILWHIKVFMSYPMDFNAWWYTY